MYSRLLGYGWPRYTGGPMFYANTIGLSQVYERICHYWKEHRKSFLHCCNLICTGTVLITSKLVVIISIDRFTRTVLNNYENVGK